MIERHTVTPALKKRLTESALRAAHASGQLLTRFFWGKAENFHRFKGQNDLVTRADLESSRIIKRQLKGDFPAHSFLFEEEEFSENNSPEFCWIVDPLDGTTFHHHGLPFFSVIIALQIGRQVELGLAFTPMTGDLFLAWRGGGCFQRNSRCRINRRLHVASTRKLQDAVIGYSYGKSQAHMAQMASHLSGLLPRCRALTRVGGADIGYVAAGGCDAFIDNSSTAWDFAAIALMVEEAGGRVSDFQGRPWRHRSTSIVVSNRMLHPQLLRLLRCDGSSGGFE